MNIRLATKDDLQIVMQLTKELATYEKEGDTFHADEKFFLDNILCNNSKAECYLIEDDKDGVVGMGEIFITLSTYTSTYKLNLQDFYIRESYRGKGYGKDFMRFLASEAKKRGCTRICWTVYTWNDLARGLYNHVGQNHDDVTSYSMGPEHIEAMLKG